MAEADERIYTIPLRKEWLKATRVKRTNRSVSTIKAFLSKHMHAEEVKLSRGINQTLWARGAKRPPGKIKVKAKKEDETVIATLPDEKMETPKLEPKKKPETPMEKAKGMLKPMEKPEETKKPEEEKPEAETKPEKEKEEEAGSEKEKPPAEKGKK